MYHRRCPGAEEIFLSIIAETHGQSLRSILAKNAGHGKSKERGESTLSQEHLTGEMLEQLTLRWEAWEAEAGTKSRKIARARLHLLFLLIRYGGLRLGEALELKVKEALDTATGMLHVPPPGARDVLLPLSCMRHIRRILSLPEAADDNFLHFDQGFVRRKFYDLARTLRLPSSMAGPRALRYARGLELLELHVPFDVVQTFLGQQKTAQISEFLAFAGGEAKRIVRGRASPAAARAEGGNTFMGIVTAMETGMRAARIEVTTFSDLVLSTLCELQTFMDMELHLNQVVTVAMDPERVFLSTEKTPGGMQGPFRANVLSLYRDVVESFLVLELPDGTRVDAVQETAALERLQLRPGSPVFLSFPARGLRLIAG